MERPIVAAVFTCLYIQSLFAKNPALIPEDYDKDIRPGFNEGVTDEVDFGLHIYQIGPLSEADMSMTADIYLRAYWTDQRLNSTAVELFERSKASIKTPFVNLKGAYAEAIWRPNIYFVDSMVENTPDEISQSSITVLTRDSDVIASDRVVIKTRCALDLRQFPLDRQTCPICFSSYEYKDSEQLIAWKEKSVNIDKNLNSTATFDIIPVLTQETIVQQWGEEIYYTKLCVHVQFRRKFKIYIVTMFLPSISLVGLSWVSFWIDKKAVPARAGLTITTILAQITLITGTANKFPGVADLKIGDIYMIVNFFFVFGSLIEFAIVNNMNKFESPPNTKPASNANENNNFVTSVASTGDADTLEMSSVVNFSPESSPAGIRDLLKPANGQSSTLMVAGRPEAGRHAGFCCRLFKERDVDDIAKVIFPSSFLLWHALFILMGLYTLEQP